MTLPVWSVVLIGVVFLAVAIFAAVILFRVVEDLVANSPFALTTGPSPSEEAIIAGQTPPAERAESTDVTNPEQSQGQVPLPVGVRPQDRVTILLLGIDQPCEFIEEPFRSDTMILLTVDPIAKTAGMLSVPRDLWVPIPSFGTNRINTAYRTGELFEYPGGGPALALATVEYNLGVHVHHYVTINYDGFVQAIDLIGGIEMDVPETINDPDYPDRCYGYDPFFLSAGHYHMDGQTALKYARTRATLGADIDRASRQQEVMLAAWDTVVRQNLTLLARAPELWNAFADNVTTDMTYQEVVGLALLAQEIQPDRLRRAAIDYTCVQDYTAPDGARVLVPVRDKIRDVITGLFSSTVVPTQPVDPAASMRSEAARIMILNGTWTAGMAGSTSRYLESLGFIVAGVGDADDKDAQFTQIIDYGGKPGTVNYLAQVMGISQGRIYGGTKPEGDFDVKLILGADWRIPES